MSQDKINEYQIPAGAAQNSAPVDNVRRDVYEAYDHNEKRPENLIDKKSEMSLGKIIEHIYSVGSDIEKARSEKISKMPQKTRLHINHMRHFFTDVSELLFSHKMPTLTNEDVARNELISKESVVGASIFGLASSKTNRYEFFYEGRDRKDDIKIDNWFYHEDKIVGNKNEHESRTLHYEVLPDGVCLIGTGYLNTDELGRFLLITETYGEHVVQEIYKNYDAESMKNKKFSSKAAKKIINFIDKSGLGGGNFAA